MSIKQIRPILILLSVLLVLSGCGYFKPKHEQEIPKETPTPVATPVEDAVTKDGYSLTAKPVSGEVRVTAVPGPLVECKTGEVNFSRIARDSELFAGPFASASLGDYVLENDQIRMAFTPPKSTSVANGGGNELIDIVHKKREIAPDYFKSFYTVPDLESTSTIFSWKSYESQSVVKYNAKLNVKGKLGNVVVTGENPVVTENPDVDVQTTWTLYACSNLVEVETEIANNSSEVLSLLPGDVFQPGDARTFVEGIGYMTRPAEVKAAFALATVDDYSVGLVNYTCENVEGIFSPNDWYIRQYGSGPFNSPYVVRSATEMTTESMTSVSPQTSPVQLENQKLFIPPSPHESDKLRENLEKLKIKESSFASPSIHEGKGGSGTNGEDGPSSPSRLMLQPGEKYTYKRAIVMSDADMSRILYEKVRKGQIPNSNVLAGLVVEQGSEHAIPNADILVSGGPGWDGKGAATPYLLTKTNSQGVFATILPAGTYEVLPAQVGRIAIEPPPIVSVRKATDAKMLSLGLSPQSFANVAVADGDIAARTGLPCKLTITTIDAFRPFEFPYTGEVGWGVRNVIYMPDGAARFPITPGKYQFVFSRGIEYDIQKIEVNVVPGTDTKNVLVMKKIIPTQGMVSIDGDISTTASSNSMLSPQNAVVMAACEGVDCLISGDYGVATDLQPYIDANGFGKTMRALRGMKMLAGGYNDVKSNVWVFPVEDDAMQTKLREFYVTNSQDPADIFLSKLKTGFPQLYVQISDPLEINRGYLANVPFSTATESYDESVIPPADFDGISLMEKNVRGYFFAMQPRYADLQRHRIKTEGNHALSPVAFSSCNSPIENEIGYPRMYVRTEEPISKLSYLTVSSALKRQNFMVTNGPILQTVMMNTTNDKYDKLPGSIIDASTTTVLRIKLNIMAAPWIDASDITVYSNGRQQQIGTIQPSEVIERFPIPGRVKTEATGRISLPVFHDEGDTFVDVVVIGTRRSLAPVVSGRSKFGSGELSPIAWVGPTFIDVNGDHYVSAAQPTVASDNVVDNAENLTTATQKMLDEMFD